MFIARAAVALSALSLVAAPAVAQVSAKTQVSHDTDVHDGVATHTTKVTRVVKRKTHRAKRILGVKVGHKTVKHKVVRTTSVSTNGDRKVSVDRK